MKYVIGASAGLAFLLGLYAWSLSGHPSYINYPPRGGRIVAFGDSLTQGVGAPDGEGFVAQISKRLGIPIENAGVSGDTTRDALKRVNVILAQNPDIVLVEFGGNDRLQGISEQEVFDNLRTLIGDIQRSGAFVILLGVRGGIASDPWSGDFQWLADESHTLYIPDILREILRDPALLSDEAHPNSEGYTRIADRITPILGSVVAEIKLPVEHP